MLGEGEGCFTLEFVIKNEIEDTTKMTHSKFERRGQTESNTYRMFFKTNVSFLFMVGDEVQEEAERSLCRAAAHRSGSV
jgi:hypothetical protein